MNQNDSPCTICLEPISDRVNNNGCQHQFCFPCLFTWATNTNRCPTCKAEFTEITRVEPTPDSRTRNHAVFKVSRKNLEATYDDDELDRLDVSELSFEEEEDEDSDQESGESESESEVGSESTTSSDQSSSGSSSSSSSSSDSGSDTDSDKVQQERCYRCGRRHSPESSESESVAQVVNDEASNSAESFKLGDDSEVEILSVTPSNVKRDRKRTERFSPQISPVAKRRK
jgi:hypothetical protein